MRRDFDGFISRQNQSVTHRQVASRPDPVTRAAPKFMTENTIRLAEGAEKKRLEQSTQQSQSEVSLDPFHSFAPPPARKQKLSGLRVDDVETHNSLRGLKTEAMRTEIGAATLAECTFAPKLVSSEKERQKASKRRSAIAQAKTEKFDELRRENSQRVETEEVPGECRYHSEVPKTTQQIMAMMKHSKGGRSHRKKNRPIWARQ
jgi:hypothetical protein